MEQVQEPKEEADVKEQAALESKEDGSSWKVLLMSILVVTFMAAAAGEIRGNRSKKIRKNN